VLCVSVLVLLLEFDFSFALIFIMKNPYFFWNSLQYVLPWQLWDLTAGKLLHEFKCHEGQIQCIDFHPHEFLLATG
jgi:WD40 repeat protein